MAWPRSSSCHGAMVGRSTSGAEQPATERSGPVVPCCAERQPATDGPALEGGGALVGGSGDRVAEALAWPSRSERSGHPERSRPLSAPPSSFGGSPAGRPAGGHVASRQDGGAGRGGEPWAKLSGRGQGPATEAPAGSTLFAAGQVALSPGTDHGGDGTGRRRARRGRGGPLFGLPVSDPHAPWRVEVPPPYRRPDLDPLGQRLHDPAAVLNVEVVPSCL